MNKELNEIYEKLKIIDNKSIEGKTAYHFLEFSIKEKECILRGNSEGLIYLATCLISLAKEKIENKHYHFDEGSIFDKVDKDLIISYTADALKFSH